MEWLFGSSRSYLVFYTGKSSRGFIRFVTINTLQPLSITQRIPPNLAIDTPCAKMALLAQMRGSQITNLSLSCH